MRNQCVCFAVGVGGFGGPRSGNKIVQCLPKPNRKPDLSLAEKTSVDQAALYRLSGKKVQFNFICLLIFIHNP